MSKKQTETVATGTVETSTASTEANASQPTELDAAMEKADRLETELNALLSRAPQLQEDYSRASLDGSGADALIQIQHELDVLPTRIRAARIAALSARVVVYDLHHQQAKAQRDDRAEQARRVREKLESVQEEWNQAQHLYGLADADHRAASDDYHTARRQLEALIQQPLEHAPIVRSLPHRGSGLQ